MKTFAYILTALMLAGPLAGEIKRANNNLAVSEDTESEESPETRALRNEIEKLHPECSIMEAYRSEISSFHGMSAHIGYFPHGYFVTLLDTNQQFFCDAGGIVDTSSEWSKDWTEDDSVLYIKHTYHSSGCYVYSSRSVQFLACP